MPWTWNYYRKTGAGPIRIPQHNHVEWQVLGPHLILIILDNQNVNMLDVRKIDFIPLETVKQDGTTT